MKDIIYLNYNIYIDEIYSNKNIRFFFKNDYKINIVECKKEEISKINKLIIITNNLYKTTNVNTFLINNNNNYFTNYNDGFIVLIRVNCFENDFCLKDITSFWNINSDLEDYDILGEWIEEVDNIENKITEYNKEYYLIQKSINYYIGMAENAISLLYDYKTFIINNNDSIGHKLSYELFNNNSIFDPFIFIKTNKMYDISNYIKYKFLKNEIDYNEIESFFLNGNEYENVFLFCNLLYPSIYFDLIKKILLDEERESKILLLVKQRKKYNKLLCFCKKIVKNNKIIRLINWIDK